MALRHTPPRSEPAKDGKKTDGKPPRYWLRRLVAVGLLGFAFLVLVFGFLYTFAKIPAPSSVAAGRAAIVEDYKGRFVGRLGEAQDRVIIPLSQVPPVVRNAVIAAEDHDFYRHKGVSPVGVLRAALSNLLAGRIKQGGSTITQQYVKNAFVGNKRTIWRKFREAVVSVKLERKWSKDEILRAYLNTIYFGRGAYGIEAAARAYFGVPASRLTLPQAALIAGIIRAPELLEPSRHEEAAHKARSRVLGEMLREKTITRQEHDAAAEAPVVVIRRSIGVSGRGPYFLEAVRRELTDRFGEDVVFRGGLRVRTTLDVDMQKAAEDAVATVLDRDGDPQAALVAVDPATGSVRAYVGGRDYSEQQFDLAGQAKRQPGSSFKPFVLAAALSNGGSLDDTYRAPGTITLETSGEPWKVSNYDHKDYGSLRAVDATAFSVNTVYAQMILRFGAEKVVAVAKSLGIRSKLQAVPSLALGTEEIAPVELAGAYGALANDGKRVRTHLIARVRDGEGTELYRFSESAQREIPENVARNVTVALRRVVESGTGRSASFGRPTAGKTGTTENHRDAWFAGYTPDLATAVWMGFPDGSRTMENVRGTQVVGGGLPARIWKAFMRKALADVEPRDFPAAEPIAPSGSPSPAPTASGSSSAVPVPPPSIPVGSSSTPTPASSPSSSPEASPTPTQSSSKKPKPSPSPSPSAGAPSAGRRAA